MKNSTFKNLRDFPSSQLRRNYLEDNLKIKLSHIAQFSFDEAKLIGKNIENLIGATQIPLGIAGPINIQGQKYFIPLATTEGALVASINRGMKAINLSVGVDVNMELVGISRGPVFKTSGIKHSQKVKAWIKSHFLELNELATQTSLHIKLLKVDFESFGKNLFVRFSYDTKDAMGMNMVTIATLEIVKEIEQKCQVSCVSLAGNFDIDKKPAWLNFINGRGRKVWAEVVIKKEVVKQVLKTTPEKIAEIVYRKCLLGSIASGSLGFNAHFANIIAAIFIATGQDLAQVVEGSLGVTTAEELENGDLYFSIYLPSLEIGTVGGGTKLPSQNEALKILGVEGEGKADEFAKIIAATTLAGELSLIASLAEGTLASAHQKYGRGKL
ncbi:hydroxymethylglutaryl-CoA reductase [Candidatus Daviesbacteria bacterium]|nr:hydroxymethylglutaryl-CoA reductase [Candidatus Daviesbacteria bacterium]